MTGFRAIEHESIIKQLCFVADIPAIIMEFAEMGNLNDLLKQQKKPVGKKFKVVTPLNKIRLDHPHEMVDAAQQWIGLSA